MAPSSRVPHHLQPYVSLPRKHNLTLLTGILGASTNWLIVRYLYAAIDGAQNQRVKSLQAPDVENVVQSENVVDGEPAVVLVSWMRDIEFWRTEVRRSVGLDLNRLAQQKRFAFVDGLTQLFSSPAPRADDRATASSHIAQAAEPRNPSSTRTPRPVDPRLPPSAARATTAAPAPTLDHGALQGRAATFSLTSCDLSHTERVISSAISSVQASSTSDSLSPVVLILDSPELLLAAADPRLGVTPAALSATLLALRRLAHSTVVALAADAPLVAAASGSSGPATAPPTPLESSHAAFVVGIAHVADVALSLRLLDTGFAADVSGVLRITRGGGAEGEDGDGDGEGGGSYDEKELLYFVGGEGGVKVFERGAEMSVG